jgi:hypothetical protein
MKFKVVASIPPSDKIQVDENTVYQARNDLAIATLAELTGEMLI